MGVLFLLTCFPSSLQSVEQGVRVKLLINGPNIVHADDIARSHVEQPVQPPEETATNHTRRSLPRKLLLTTTRPLGNLLQDEQDSFGDERGGKHTRNGIHALADPERPGKRNVKDDGEDEIGIEKDGGSVGLDMLEIGEGGDGESLNDGQCWLCDGGPRPRG